MIKQFSILTFGLIFSLNLFAQGEVEFKFDKTKPFLKYNSKNPSLNYIKLSDAVDESKSLLFFIGFHDTDSVKVSSEEKILLNKKLYYSEQTGISEVKIIDNTKNIMIIFFKEIPVKIELKKNSLRKFKHIYISRKKNKYIVEYSNSLKPFA